MVCHKGLESSAFIADVPQYDHAICPKQRLRQLHMQLFRQYLVHMYSQNCISELHPSNPSLAHDKGDMNFIAASQSKITHCSIPNIACITKMVHLCYFDIFKVFWNQVSINLEFHYLWKILPSLLPGLGIYLWQFIIPSYVLPA